jgi:hypothetical protein
MMPGGGAGGRGRRQPQTSLSEQGTALIDALAAAMTHEGGAKWAEGCAACAHGIALVRGGPLRGDSVACALLHCVAGEYAARGAEAAPGGLAGAAAASALLAALESVAACDAALAALEQRGALVPLPAGMDSSLCSAALIAHGSRAEQAARRASGGHSDGVPTTFATGREGEFAGAVCSLRLAALCLRLAAALHGASAGASAAPPPPLEALLAPALRALRCMRPAHAPCCKTVRGGMEYTQLGYVCFGPLPHAEAAFGAALAAALPSLPASLAVVTLREMMASTAMEKKLLDSVGARLAEGANMLAAMAATGAGVAKVYPSDGSEAVRVSSRARARGLRACDGPGCTAKEAWPGQFKKCSRCKSVAYCGAEHHVAHWKAGHKRECAALAAAAAAEAEAEAAEAR